MTVELHSAFVWDCDECGAENFNRTREVYLDQEELCGDEVSVESHLVATGVSEDGSEAQFLTQKVVLAPNYVTCKSCNATLAAEVFGDPDDEEEQG